jgi:hypothetical protein
VRSETEIFSAHPHHEKEADQGRKSIMQDDNLKGV